MLKRRHSRSQPNLCVDGGWTAAAAADVLLLLQVCARAGPSAHVWACRLGTSVMLSVRCAGGSHFCTLSSHTLSGRNSARNPFSAHAAVNPGWLSRVCCCCRCCCCCLPCCPSSPTLTRAPLHTLALECSCCPRRYVCPYHAAALCECGPREWRLLYRFTLAQLRDRLEEAAGRVGMVSVLGCVCC